MARLDGDDDDRAIAARALAAPHHLEAVPALARVLLDDHASAPARVAAAEALAAIGDVSAVEAIADVLQDDDARVRRAAVRALCALDGSARSVPAFLHACADPDADVRSAGLSALLVIGGAAACTAAKKALTDDVGPVRALAVVVLGRHGGPRHVEPCAACSTTTTCACAAPRARPPCG